MWSSATSATSRTPSSLTRSVNSIIKQNHIPDEVIVVIDGPIGSDLAEVISKFVKKSDISVKLIHLPTTAGLWNARNQGISVARNEFIALHDADDVMHPDRLGVQIEQMLTDKIDVLGSPVFEFDSDNGNEYSIPDIVNLLFSIRYLAFLIPLLE